MTGRTILAALAGAVLAHGSAAGQAAAGGQSAAGSQSAGGGFEAEVRGGLTVGSHSASAAALDIAPAVSVDVTVKRRLMPSLAVFAGYYRTAFGCEEGYCTGRDIQIVGNHGAVGAEWTPGMPWVRGGVLLGTTRAGSEGDGPAFGIGFHLGAGLSVGSGRFRFLPGVSYRWLSDNSSAGSENAIAMALDMGFGYQLGGGGP